MEKEELIKTVDFLASQPVETELFEFKHNFHSEDEIGKIISAISNSACLRKQPYGYLIFGIEDANHEIVGTSFNCKTKKIGKEELENWLANMLTPRIDFISYSFEYSEGINISLYKIPAADGQPTNFKKEAYIRQGSSVRKLTDFPEKQKAIWKNPLESIFEKEIAKEKVSASDVISLLDTNKYFELLEQPYPHHARFRNRKICK